MQNLVLTLKSSLVSNQFTPILLSFTITVLACPLMIRWAPRIKLFDHPQESSRKIHHRVKPLGGAAVLFGFLPVLILSPATSLPLIFATLIAFFTGLTDDIRGLSPKSKLFFQILTALLVVTFHGVPFTNLPVFPGLNFSLSGIPNLILIGFWLVGGMNAYNLIDGLDGLATGLGILAILPLIILTFGHPSFLLLGGLGAGLAGILFYNFYPAKLFLGDGGSYLLGFLVSYLTIHGLSVLSTHHGNWSLPVGILLLGFPIIDTTLAIVRRTSSETGILEPDQNHLHHKLYRKFDHVTAVLIIYFLQSVLSATALIVIL